MKRSTFRPMYTKITGVFLISLLTCCFFFSCQRDNDESQYPQYTLNLRFPQWITDTLSAFDTDLSDLHPDTIWQYYYKGSQVFYFPAWTSDDVIMHDELYNRWGRFLGYPDGGPNGDGDSLIEDFFDWRSLPMMIWHDGIWPNTIRQYDYDIINAVIEYQYGDSSFIHLQNRSTSQVFIDSTIKYLNIAGIDYDPLMLTAFSLKNYSDYFWDLHKFSAPVVVLNPYEELDLSSYREQYPDSFGLLRFSTPAVSPFEDFAIVEYLIYDLDFTQRTRYTCLLQHTGNSWNVTYALERHDI